MVSHLAEAYKFDLGARPRLTPPQGVLTSPEIGEGTVFSRNGVTVSAFLVAHGNAAPAFGYRIDFGGRRIVLSGDTTFNERLIENSAGADVLIYDVAAAAESVLPGHCTCVERAHFAGGGRNGFHASAAEAGCLFAYRGVRCVGRRTSYTNAKDVRGATCRWRRSHVG